MSSSTDSRTVRIDYLPRVEGEGGVEVRVRRGKVTGVQLKIFEPPRFFEAFLRGRDFREAPDLTARICGICPVAYQMTAVHAMEKVCGVALGGPLRELRRLLYCGEWIESHALHIYMLHAPDFLGYPDVIRMAADHPEAVRNALQLKKAGNEIVRVLGGREIHPVNVRVGGFYRLPGAEELLFLRGQLEAARELALNTVRLVARFPFPDFEQDYEFVGLRHDLEYPMNEGRIVSSRGLDIDVSEYEDNFKETHVEHSNALHSTLRGGGVYFVGPLARFVLNFDHLTPAARDAALDAGTGPECRNPFRSIVVRAVETLYACEEGLRILEVYRPPDSGWVDVEPVEGSGCACTEAPRGMLYHRYRIDASGIIRDAKIVPPTAQNQKVIERDLWNFVPGRLHFSRDELRRGCEQAVRNYDPCISCATHFVNLHLEKP